MDNTFEIEILPSGDVKITTEKFAPAIHAKAEDALRKYQEALGGKVEMAAAARKGITHSHGGVRHTH